MMNSEMHEGAGWTMMGGMGLIALIFIAFLITGIVYFVRNSR